MGIKNCFLLLFLFCINLGFAQKEISLNGNWEIVFDHHNEGAKALWHENDIFQSLEYKRKIKVPK